LEKKVSPKKHLGQHFLTDLNIAKKIVDQLTLPDGINQVLEIGPGMGVLTQYLLQHTEYQTSVIEIDRESVAYLQTHFPALENRILSADFLKLNLAEKFPGKLSIIGNFPYNISSQIFFRVLAHHNQVLEVVGMLQKEVAERIAEPPGSKAYGILSVLLQAYYDITYNFTVHENVFNPPPKVKSAVISLVRNKTEKLPCSETLFFEVVKQSFSTRRKTLRNCLKTYNLPQETTSQPIFDQRAEQLGVADFVELTKIIENFKTQATI